MHHKRKSATQEPPVDPEKKGGDPKPDEDVLPFDDSGSDGDSDPPPAGPSGPPSDQ